MKVLVATRETQGTRSNDFCWAEEGELVGPCFEHDGEKIDGPCGCRRCFSGLSTRRGTTTVKVVEQELDEAGFFLAFTESQSRAGFGAAAEKQAREMLRLANAFPVGSVLEKRGTRIRQR